MKTTFAKKIDTIILNAILLFATIILLRKYFNFINSLFASIAIIICVQGLLRIKRTKKKSTLLTTKQRQHMEECFLNLALQSNIEQLDFFYMLFYQDTVDKTTQEQATDTTNNQTQDNQNDQTQPSHLNTPQLKPSTVLIEPTLEQSPISKKIFELGFMLNDNLYIVDLKLEFDSNNLIKYINYFLKNNCVHMHILTYNPLPTTTKELLSSLIGDKYTIYNQEQLYEKMLISNKYPTITIKQLSKSKLRTQLYSTMFNPLNTRKYLITSAIIFLFAYFYSSNIFYLLLGFINLSFAFICKVRGLKMNL